MLSKTAKEIFNAVRGYYSWPCAYFLLDGKRVKVIKAALGENSGKPVSTVADNTNDISVVAADGVTVRLLEIQAEGGKAMTSKQFLCGKRLEIGTLVGENND